VSAGRLNRLSGSMLSSMGFRLLCVMAGVMCFAYINQGEGLRRDGPQRVAEGSGTAAEWPLRFRRHMFGAICFSTTSCSIRYHGFEHGTDRPTASRPNEADHNRRMTASFGDIRNFSRPAVVTWQPRSGGELNAEIDLAAIFGDDLIRHTTRRDDIPEGVSMGFTHVLIEIDDRTISVYTRTMIPLKQPLIPGNRFSHFRDDLIRVHSKAY
jgi:hypothetical protein